MYICIYVYMCIYNDVIMLYYISFTIVILLYTKIITKKSQTSMHNYLYKYIMIVKYSDLI